MHYRRDFQVYVNTMCRIAEHNPNRQMSDTYDNSDAQSYKHDDILPEHREMKKIADNIAGWAFH